LTVQRGASNGTLSLDRAGKTLEVLGSVTIGEAGSAGSGRLNIPAGDMSVGGALTVNSNAVAHISGGTLTVLDGPGNLTVNSGGVVNVDGGSLISTNGGGHLSYGGDGLVKIQSGEFMTGQDLSTEYFFMGVDFEISGGTVDLGNQNRIQSGHEFKVIGDEAAITVKHFTGPNDNAATISFVLNEAGVSTITNTSWAYFNHIKIQVDGSAYTGGVADIVLVDGGMHPDRLAPVGNITVTGFSELYTATVVQDTVANEMRLEISDGTIIADEFSAPGSPALGGRVAESNIDAGWMASWGPSNSSEWVVADGVMQNSATNTGAYPNAIASEGALVQVVSHGADSNTAIKLSFDYDVSTGDTLYVHLWGLDSTNALDGNWFANPQPCNGFIYDRTDRNAGLEAYSLKDGMNKAGGLVAHSGQALTTLTGSGTFSLSISLADLGISGIATAGDFEYYLLAFCKEEDGTEGTTSIDNLRLASIPKLSLWESDMDVDPVNEGWAVRGAADGYTLSGGVLSMGEGAGGALIDTLVHPDAQWAGLTKVDLVWRATSYQADPDGFGAGLWINVDGDAPDYGAIHFDAMLLGNDTQTVVINSAGDGSGLAGRIATLPGFGAGMLTLSAEINSYAETITYMVTDGTLTNSATVGYTPLGTAGTPGMATLFTGGPAAEIDYVRIEPNAEVAGTPFEIWAFTHGLGGADAAPDYDYERDGLDNLMEYAIGGDPTVNDRATVGPFTEIMEDSGTEYLYHVYRERTDDASLTFTVGASEDLILNPFDTNDVSLVGESGVVDSYKTVTNRTVASSDTKFIQLEVQQD
jgi:hypothetical protein